MDLSLEMPLIKGLLIYSVEAQIRYLELLK
ncbi:hypothetical protein V6Z12_A12G087200 [Gossypium hirsutum]